MRDLTERKERIVEFMREAAYKPLKYEELAVILDVPKEERELFANVLDELEQEGKIYKTNKDKYGLPEKMNLVAGRLQGNERGYGFLIPDDEMIRDIFIPADGIAGAMNNDRVIARVTVKGIGDKRPEGEVVKVLKRANSKIVGTFESSKYFGFVIPDDRRVPGDIFIPKDEVNGAKPGYKVVAEIIKWPDHRRNAEGKIIEVIGDINTPGNDIISILKSYDLQESFPEEVLKQAESIPEKIDEKMLKDRRDLRKLRMVTIDGEDAKDLDDAVSIERLPGTGYRLGVHIADVSSYVTEGSPLDVEAFNRGTSVYLVDRVIPMLPKKLSNGVCSLNPQADRLAFTVMMDIDFTGKVINHDIFESVIRTAERMTYTNVYKLLETEDEELSARYGPLVEDFRIMRELALILRKKRMDRGAIDFNFDEAKIILDEKGKPIDIRRYEITIANRIIEEFMLVCNETVAERFYWAGAPFVYRVHEDPDSEKIMAFAEFAHNLGYHVKGLNKIHPRALQAVLDQVKGSKEEMIISTVMLRSLAKAKYSHENLGHFGLAAKYYCHFTSPIRRYPDLIIHRLMKEVLKGGMTQEREENLLKQLPETARLCSARERAADEAERETEDLKKVEYMQERVGETFVGVISNVTSFGMFVELENTIEGLVRVSNMDDDYYVFDDKHYCLIGERTKKRYRIGDEIKIRVARADIATKQLDFVIEEEEGGRIRKCAAAKNKTDKPEKSGTDDKLPQWKYAKDGEVKGGSAKSKSTRGAFKDRQANQPVDAEKDSDRRSGKNRIGKSERDFRKSRKNNKSGGAAKGDAFTVPVGITKLAKKKLKKPKKIRRKESQ